jgi:hypothetical protein
MRLHGHLDSSRKALVPLPFEEREARISSARSRPQESPGVSLRPEAHDTHLSIVSTNRKRRGTHPELWAEATRRGDACFQNNTDRYPPAGDRPARVPLSEDGVFLCGNVHVGGFSEKRD